jgi:Na+-driven multidrug efflux pump
MVNAVVKYRCSTLVQQEVVMQPKYEQHIIFGENNPSMAKLSGYKSLLLSMTVALVVSCVYISLQNDIPAWFTVDKTLQAMLTELVPFVGVGNSTMQFGMTSWSLIGAQGKYKLATWVSFISSWGVAMPLAAMFVLWGSL